MAKKILIIEDYPATVEVVNDILSLKGFEVLTATDGISGIKTAVAQKPGLILLDIMMPGMNGLEVLGELKKKPETKNIPVVIVSVKSTEEDIHKGMAAGAVDYLVKPFVPVKLLEIIGKY